MPPPRATGTVQLTGSLRRIKWRLEQTEQPLGRRPYSDLFLCKIAPSVRPPNRDSLPYCTLRGQALMAQLWIGDPDGSAASKTLFRDPQANIPPSAPQGLTATIRGLAPWCCSPILG